MVKNVILKFQTLGFLMYNLGFLGSIGFEVLFCHTKILIDLPNLPFGPHFNNLFTQ